MSLSNAKSLLNVGKAADVRSFIANGVIVAGRTVSFDETKTDESRVNYVVEGAADSLVIGVALEAASAAGVEVRVACGGYVEGALTDGNVASGDALMGGAGGTLIPYTAASLLPIVGVALETDTGTACDVFIFRRLP